MSLLSQDEGSSPGSERLQVGNVGLTLIEQRTHFALWCLLGGPLLISTDLRTISTDALRILKAKELIAINQDRLVAQGIRVSPPNATGSEIWIKRLSGGRYGLILLNRGATPADIVVDFATTLVPHDNAPWALRDLWKETALGSFRGNYTAHAVPSHGNVALLATPGERRLHST